MKTLYETDFSAWLESQVQALKKKDFEHLDIENLLEEMETLGTSEKSAIESYIVIILIHLIKRHVQADRSGKSWDDSIINSRVQIETIIGKNPSLRSYPRQVFSKCYTRALKIASKQMSSEVRCFPSGCLWSIEEVLG